MSSPAPCASPRPSVACSNCGLRELCLPVGLSDGEMADLDTLVSGRQTVRRGETLFRSGDRFGALYAVRIGFFKTITATGDGRAHVTGFRMAGELLGLDGFADESHPGDAIALEDSQVCVIPCAGLEALSLRFPSLQRHLHRVMSREIAHEHGLVTMLRSMRAEGRLAAFLANLARRLQARGFSPTAFVLRMTRQEIGTYLGLQLETVSRSFSRLHEARILQVRQRDIRILDTAALQRLAVGSQD